MLSEDQKRAAAELLWRHWQEGRRLAALPEPLRPQSRAEGYAVQALIESRSSEPLYGWKIAATSAAGQAHIGVDGPLLGRILLERAFASGAELRFGRNHMRVAEPEFAFRMGCDLLPRDAPYAMQEVMQAVDSLHPAIEVPDSRFEDFARVGAPQLIADNACAHEFVLGPAAPPAWRSLDLALHTASGTVVGKVERLGTGSNVLDDPRSALVWAVNELSALGLALRAGQVVTTGTCMTPLPIGPGDSVTADFGILGAVSLRFAAV